MLPAQRSGSKAFFSFSIKEEGEYISFNISFTFLLLSFLSESENRFYRVIADIMTLSCG